MRVGIIQLSRGHGGSNITYELAQAWAERAELVVYLSHNNPLLNQWKSVQCTQRLIHAYNGFPSLIASLLRGNGPQNLARMIDKDRLDVLMDNMAGPWSELVKRQLSSRPLLADIVHDPKLHADRWRLLLTPYRLLFRRRADVYIGLSEHSHRQLNEIYPNKPQILSHHGIILPAPNEVPEERTERIVQQRHRFLFFGRIERYKGVQVLARAFELARQHNSSLNLSVVGAGPLDTKTIRMLRNSGAYLRHARVSNEELLGLVNQHGIVVLPYLSASQSGPASIAMGRGHPCIATNVGALPEQVIHGQNGLVVPPSNSYALAREMLRMADDPEMVRTMSRGAFHLAATTYAWENIAGRLLDDLEAAHCTWAAHTTSASSTPH